MGKSELILKFLGERPGIYFLGKRAPGALQIREFLEEAAVVVGEPLLATHPASGWGPALDAVLDRWGPERGKVVIALDEFQWIAEASPELPSVLQERWDRRWKKDRQVMLILCGSYVGFMEREVLGKKSPLFGRRTAQIQLRPFGYREAALFHPNASVVDRARIHFICGGIPLYLEQFAPERSVEMNIKATLLNDLAPLYHEPDFLLREELREVESYYAILFAVATGAPTAREIAQRTSIGERSLHYYVSQLGELGYLRRRHPLTDRPPAARHVRYEIDDALLAFWFRFVFPNTSFMLQMGAERALAERIRPQLDAWFGVRFEHLCREALPHLYEREAVSAGFEIGEYWDKTTQIDVIGLRDDNWTDVGECKWGAYGSPRKALVELKAKVAQYPNARNATIGQRIFIKDGAPRESERGPARWHTVADLYA